ncbi:unnamed protein product [Thelazia callipaeda]|uniref:Sex-determining region Y protein n=1 Tax=Thelazia callipaeda TaxID=103827 RepID=A0A0N5DA77_THECL|nr:unnamed protein product [Thelazia callipaeda]
MSSNETIINMLQEESLPNQQQQQQMQNLLEKQNLRKLQDLITRQYQSVITNATSATIDDDTIPSSSCISTTDQQHGGSSEMQFTSKETIEGDQVEEVNKHSNEMKEVNEYVAQKRIKRPMNAFMVWSQMRRAQIASTDVKMHNSQISKELGAEWREMSVEDKAPYVKRAKELREELMRRHPNYVYRPKRRSHGTSRNLFSKTSGVVRSMGPSVPQVSFARSNSLPVLPAVSEDIRNILLARMMQEQQNSFLLAAYSNQLLAATASTTALKDYSNLDLTNQLKQKTPVATTAASMLTCSTATTGNAHSSTPEQFNAFSALPLLQSSFNAINNPLGSQFNPFHFS